MRAGSDTYHNEASCRFVTLRGKHAGYIILHPYVAYNMLGGGGGGQGRRFPSEVGGGGGA